MTLSLAYFENHDAFKRFWFRPRVYVNLPFLSCTGGD